MKLGVCTEANLVDCMKAIKPYFDSRKRGHLLPGKILLSVLKAYLELVCFRPITGLFIVRINSGDWVRCQFEGHDEKGNSVAVGPLAICRQIIPDVARDLARTLDLSLFQELMELISSALGRTRLPDEVKLLLLDIEIGTLRGAYEAYAWKLSSEQSHHIDTRKRFVLSQLDTIEPSGPNGQTDLLVEALNDAYAVYVSWEINLLVSQNRHDQIIPTIVSETTRTTHRGIVGKLLPLLLFYNGIFVLSTRQQLRDILTDLKSVIPEEIRPHMKEEIDFSVGKLGVEGVSLERNPFPTEEADSTDIRTIVDTVALCDMDKESVTLQVSPGCRLHFTRIVNPLEDPIYLALFGSGIVIDGLPIAAFSDSIARPTPATLIVAEFDEFFHPDFEFKDGSVVRVDFGEKTARIGRVYYPYKERVWELLWRLQKETPDQFPLIIERSNLTINILSNHMVNFTRNSGEPIYSAINLLTNVDSLDWVRRHHRDRMNELVLSDGFSTELARLSKVEISSSVLLRQFVANLIETHVEAPLREGIGQRMLWDSSRAEPAPEIAAQDLVELTMKRTLEFKRIDLAREPNAAGGNVDFTCSHAGEDLYRICIELKNAHNDRIEHGIEKQLPAYMDSKRTRDGLFLVLWYKNNEFPKPQRFATPEELKHHLTTKIPPGYRISVVVIDCNRQPVPSRL